MAPLEEESDAEAAEATKTWWQRTSGKVVVGVTTAVVLGVLGWLWQHIETQAHSISTGAKNGRTARKLAAKNRKRVENLSEQTDKIDDELHRTQTKVLQRLDTIQSSLQDNREMYKSRFEQLRRDIRSIERHHYRRRNAPMEPRQ